MDNSVSGPIPKPSRATHTHGAESTDNELVIVVGAGITGLSAAWFLQRQGYEVLVLEASASLGGNVQTVTRDGYQFERGPNTFINNREAMQELISGLGLQDELCIANQAAHKRYVAKNGRLEALPNSVMSAIKTPLLSWQGKLRLLLEPFIGQPTSDESIAQLARRRLGQEAYDWLMDPFVSGIFAGDPERLSVSAALPRLHALQKNAGSLCQGFWSLQRAQRAASKSSAQPSPLHNKMLSLKGGMSQLMERIAEGLINPVQLNMEVDKVAYSPKNGYFVQSGDTVWQAPKLLLALPAMQVARLIDDLPSPNMPSLQNAQQTLRALEYPALASISMAFKKRHIIHPLDGFGALFPSKEHRQTLGVLFPSSIFTGRAPKDEHLLTVFIGGARGTLAMQMDDKSRLELVLGELKTYLGITGSPLWHIESLWPAAIPQYYLGHQQKVADIVQAVAHLPHLYLCGSWRDGVSLSDCVSSGKMLAQQVANEDVGESIHA